MSRSLTVLASLLVLSSTSTRSPGFILYADAMTPVTPPAAAAVVQPVADAAAAQIVAQPTAVVPVAPVAPVAPPVAPGKKSLQFFILLLLFYSFCRIYCYLSSSGSGPSAHIERVVDVGFFYGLSVSGDLLSVYWHQQGIDLDDDARSWRGSLFGGSDICVW